MIIRIRYNRERIGEEHAVIQIKKGFEDALRDLSEKCAEANETRTASDYGDVKLSMEQIEDLEELFSIE